MCVTPQRKPAIFLTLADIARLLIVRIPSPGEMTKWITYSHCDHYSHEWRRQRAADLVVSTQSRGRILRTAPNAAAM